MGTEGVRSVIQGKYRYSVSSNGRNLALFLGYNDPFCSNGDLRPHMVEFDNSSSRNQLVS